METYIISTDKEEFKLFNGMKASIVHQFPRTDGLVEVYVHEMNVFILLEPKELSDD